MANQYNRRDEDTRPRLTRAQAEEIQRRRAMENARRGEKVGRKRRTSSKKNRRSRYKKNPPILKTIIAIVLVLAIGITAFGFSKMSKLNYKKTEGVETVTRTGGYTNIALFGLDSREGELNGGVNSDTIIVASINNWTHDVKLVSVYRDTCLMVDDDYYYKANSAYCTGGPSQAITMLNRNLDLDITKYISVNFNALITAVDILGGIDVEMDAEEAYWLDCYIGETSLVSGVGSYQLPDENGGTYHLNGVQATAYCRIRYTAGNDFRRTERQRLVLQKILEKAKHSNPKTLNNLADAVLPQIQTNISSTRLIWMGMGIFLYDLEDSTGFPFDQYPSYVARDGQEMVVPIDLAANVKQLHEYLYPGKKYTVSEMTQRISDDIMYITGITGE